jgi:D-amino-acid dehydrogenase
MSPRRADVAVLGSGVIGLACAFHLMQRGLRCVLVDAAGAGRETSYGNAGSISVGNVLPQSTPGILGKAVRMLFDANAPLKLDLPRLPSYAGWLWRFVRHGDRRGILPIVDALHAINTATRAPWLAMARDIGAADLLAETGYLHVYSEEQSFEGAAWERQLMRERAVRHEILDRVQLQALEPGLGPGFERGVFQNEALALLDPGGFCARLSDTLVARGALAVTARVSRVETGSQGVTLHTDAGPVHAELAVLAAGAWSNALLAPLGHALPLVPARGYHLMYAPQPAVVRRPVLWAERYMVVSPMRDGIRMTSIKELTTLGSRANFSWIHKRDADARRLFPALAGPPLSEWAGYRPCTPDSLPVIDRLGERLWLATGHGHLGVTQAAITGKLIAQMVAGAPTDIDITPYRMSRFA